MFKKILFFLVLLSLSNCSGPGTALLGPAFTGATTKSVARASLSLTSNQIIKNIQNETKNLNNKVINVAKKFDLNSNKNLKLDFHK